MSAPFVLRADEGGGGATVYARRGGFKVGRVLQNFYGDWEAFDLGGVKVAFCRYRREAAEALWAEAS